jgi:hypothetical protein
MVQLYGVSRGHFSLKPAKPPIQYHDFPFLSFSTMTISPFVIFLKKSWSGLYNMKWKCSRACTLLSDCQFLNHTRLSLATRSLLQKVSRTNSSILARALCVRSPVAESSSRSILVVLHTSAKHSGLVILAHFGALQLALQRLKMEQRKQKRKASPWHQPPRNHGVLESLGACVRITTLLAW